MGSSFYVLPLQPEAMSVAALGDAATAHLRSYLSEVPLEELVDLPAPLLAEAQSALAAAADRVRVVLGGVGAPAERWGLDGEPLALAFHVEPGAGGGRVTRFPVAQSATLLQAARAGAAERGVADELDRRLVHGVAYRVERTLGQPPLAVLAHGFVAAALAQATDGRVVSDDGAWDDAAWPSGGAELAASYLRPRWAQGEEYRRRAEAMQREVPSVLKPFDGPFVMRVLDEIVTALVREVNRVRGDEEAELAAFDRALGRFDTVRLLGTPPPLPERDLLLGAGALGPRGTPPSAFGRLRPAPEEYERWLAHLGERLA